MNSSSSYFATIDQVSNGIFDFVIAGGGLGGATCAYSLAKRGYKVLIIEKGTADLSRKFNAQVNANYTKPEDRLKFHLWPTRLTTIVNEQESSLYTPTGTGLGGSSRLYAGALERLEPIDLMPQKMPNQELVEWPYAYDELVPYYEQAEQLFNVRGSRDPLSSVDYPNLSLPDEINALDQHFFGLFKESGLNPYHLHVAKSKKTDDRHNEVMSALEACILPALETGNMMILEESEVTKIHTMGNKVNEVSITHMNKSYRISVKRLILAAGALFTPILLQRSKSEYWPNGIGNNNDLVGRNLMFHVSDYVGIWGYKNFSKLNAGKTIGIRDFYVYDGKKLGQLQSMGLNIDYGYILYFLRNKFEQSSLNKLPILNKIVYQLLRLPALVAVYLFKDACIYSSVIEDFPYPQNRVIYDVNNPSNLKIVYKVSGELKQRVRTFRKLLKDKINSKLTVILNGELMLNYGHPCGTCKAGKDPTKNVLDSNGKLHGMTNLYISDASFMPTSGGTNPSLTIIANALRIADMIFIEDSK